MMLDGCRAAPSRPIGRAPTMVKVARPESRGSLGAKWRTGRPISIGETPGRTGLGMFVPAIHEAKTTQGRERRRRAARVVANGLALPHHPIVEAAGRRPGAVEALMKAAGTGPQGTAAGVTASRLLRFSAGLVPPGIIQPPLHHLQAA
jgi:hypothetical protein